MRRANVISSSAPTADREEGEMLQPNGDNVSSDEQPVFDEHVTRERTARAADECSRRLTSAFEGIHPGLRAAMTGDVGAEVRACIEQYATALREAHAPPERMLLAVKRLAADAFPAGALDSRTLMNTIVSWAIAAYYAED